MARFLADENFPLPVVEEMRRLGEDTLTLSELGLAGQALPDGDVLKLGIDQKRAILTLNRKHFIRLHLEAPDHTGIVVCTFDSNFEAHAARIREAVNLHDQLDGLLLRVNRPDR